MKSRVWNPSSNIRSQTLLHMLITLTLRDRDRRIPRTWWSDSLGKIASFWFTENPYLKPMRWRTIEEHTQHSVLASAWSYRGIHTTHLVWTNQCTRARKHTHTHTHTLHTNQNKLAFSFFSSFIKTPFTWKFILWHLHSQSCLEEPTELRVCSRSGYPTLGTLGARQSKHSGALGSGKEKKT